MTPGENAQFVSFRLTPAQKAKFNALGGGAWAREQIDKAPEPKKADHGRS